MSVNSSVVQILFAIDAKYVNYNFILSNPTAAYQFHLFLDVPADVKISFGEFLQGHDLSFIGANGREDLRRGHPVKGALATERHLGVGVGGRWGGWGVKG